MQSDIFLYNTYKIFKCPTFESTLYFRKKTVEIFTVDSDLPKEV